MACDRRPVFTARAYVSPHGFHADSQRGAHFMEKRLCAACRRLFKPRPQVPHQAYCAAAACQRERRRRWHKAKRGSDPDYHDNQRRAQRAWSSRNPDYWREYRRTHPGYRERNKILQRIRNRAQSNQAIAKMDVSGPATALLPGIYRIVACARGDVAKKNAWTAEISWISGINALTCARCKERIR